MPHPLSLNDVEYDAIMRAAGSVHPAERDAFLRALADELAKHPVTGLGLVHRLAADLQRRFTVQARADAETHKGEVNGRGRRRKLIAVEEA
jgi:hypothetical protein